MPPWTPKEQEEIGITHVVEAFKKEYRSKYHIEYVVGEKDSTAAVKLSGTFGGQAELADFMRVGIEYLESNEYWRKRICIHGVSMCVNDIRMKMQRDIYERIEAERDPVSDAVRKAREFWARVRLSNYGCCARCGGEGTLSWKDKDKYEYAALCSCQNYDSTFGHYDDKYRFAQPWHNNDFIWLQENKGAFTNGQEMLNSIGKELCDLFRAGGGTYYGSALIQKPVEA